MIQVPSVFAASTVAREGAAGERWINSLPDLVEEHCELWGLKPIDPVRYGYMGVVVPAIRDGVRLALKVSWIDESSKQEALVLHAWDGRGAVRLLESREESGALQSLLFPSEPIWRDICENLLAHTRQGFSNSACVR